MPELQQPATWTWYHTNWAVRSGDLTFVTWHEPGQIWIGAYHETAQTWRTFKLIDTGEVDDHNVASVGVRADGRLIAAYCTHEDMAMRVRVSTSPLDVTVWGDEQLAATVAAGDIITYPNLIYLSAEDRWYLFFRYRPPSTGSIRFVTSDDDGQTWSAMTTLIVPIGGEDARPYQKWGSNGTNRIDLSITRGHPREEPTNSIWHMWYDATLPGWRNSAGVSLGALPLQPDDGTLVHDGTTIKGWNWDMATGAGNPVMLFARFPNSDPAVDHRYMYARWTGAAWDVNEIVSGGGRIVTRGQEDHYSGGLVLDHADTSVVYLSRQVGQAWELQRWTTGDGGHTWSSTPITAGSPAGVKHARPFVVRGDTRVIWWGGTYETPNGIFHTNLFADPPLLLPDPPPLTSQVGDFAPVLGGSHTPVFEARVLTSFQSGDDPPGIDLPIVDGDVQYDATAEVFATLALTTQGVDPATGRPWFPRLAADLLAPYGNEVFVRRGVDLGGTGILWSPLGIFRIETAEQAGDVEAPIMLAGSDRMAALIESDVLAPREFGADTSVSAFFAVLVGEVYPDAEIILDDDAGFALLGRQIVVDESRYEPLLEVADGLGKVMFFDGQGRLRVTAPPDDAVPVWTVAAGRAGVLVEASRRLSRRGAPNGVMVIGEGGSDQDPVSGVAIDTGPRSPTRWGGRYGKVLVKEQLTTVTTELQAENAARELLRRRLGVPHSADFGAVVNPGLRPRDPIVVVHRDGNRDRHVVQTLTVPLTAGQHMTGTTRERTAVVIGNVIS